MYNELLKEFQKSIAIKEQADQLVIGTRPATKEKEPVKKIFDTPPPAPTPPPPPVEKVEEIIAEPEPVAKEIKQPKEDMIERPVLGLKVKGKIDLESKAKPKAKKTTPAVKPVKISAYFNVKNCWWRPVTSILAAVSINSLFALI